MYAFSSNTGLYIDSSVIVSLKQASFTHLNSVHLEVCNEIDQWPNPSPGQTLNLPIVGVVLQVSRGKRR